MFPSFILFRTIVRHEMSKFSNGQGDVWFGTVGQVHGFSDQCMVRKRHGNMSFAVGGGAHVRHEMEREA